MHGAAEQCVAVDRAFNDCGVFAALTGHFLLKSPATERERCGCNGVDLTAGSAGVILTGKISQEASMFDAATTTLSSKGQVVNLEAIRERLGLKTGAQFVVVADRDVVILKVLELPALSEFAALTAQARRAAKAAGLKSADVPRAIKKVRRTK